MRYLVAIGVFLGGLAVVALAGADPIRIDTVRVVQLDTADVTRLVQPSEAVPTFHSLNQYFSFLVDFTGPSGEVLQLLVEEQAHTVPAGVDGVVVGMSVPRRYQPTAFHADLTLVGTTGVLDQRRVEWIASTPVPEPQTLGLLAWGLGAAALFLRRRRREAVA